MPRLGQIPAIADVVEQARAAAMDQFTSFTLAAGRGSERRRRGGRAERETCRGYATDPTSGDRIRCTRSAPHGPFGRRFGSGPRCRACRPYRCRGHGAVLGGGATGAGACINNTEPHSK